MFKLNLQATHKSQQCETNWTMDDLKFFSLGLSLLFVVWPIIISTTSFYLHRTEIAGINRFLFAFSDIVLSIVPESAMKAYYLNVKTNLYHTGIIMAVGWFVFFPHIFLMIIYYRSSFFLPLERTFPNTSGFKPVWAGLLLRLLIMCGLAYLFIFHGFYVSQFKRKIGYVATSLTQQGMVAALFGTFAAFTVSVVINTGYQVQKYIKERKVAISFNDYKPKVGDGNSGDGIPR